MSEDKKVKEEKTEETKEETKEEIKLKGDSKKVMEMVEKMNVLELNDLVKALEDKFGVSAAAPVMMGAMPAGAAGNNGEAEQVEAQTEDEEILA